jgi:hypothetical protein
LGAHPGLRHGDGGRGAVDPVTVLLGYANDQLLNLSFGLAHRAMLLAPAEDAFGHLSTSLRDLVADVASCARIDRAPATLAGVGEAIVLRNMRCDAHPAQPPWHNHRAESDGGTEKAAERTSC